MTYCRPMVFLAFFTRFRERVLGAQDQSENGLRDKHAALLGGVGSLALGPHHT